MKVIGVPGIHSWGEGSTSLVLDRLKTRGVTVLPLRFGRRNALNARWNTQKDANEIVRHSDPGDVLVAHSRGCVIAARASEQIEYRHIFVIAPAHSRRYEWFNPGRVTCFHSKGDWIVNLGSRLIAHPFGKAGLTGYRQRYVKNIGVSSDHDDYFEEPILSEIVNRVYRACALE